MRENDPTPIFPQYEFNNLNEMFPSSYRHFTLRTLKNANAFRPQDPELIYALTDLHDLAYLVRILYNNNSDVEHQQAVERWESIKWRIIYNRCRDHDQQNSVDNSQSGHILKSCQTASMLFISLADPTIIFSDTDESSGCWQLIQWVTNLVLTLRSSIAATDLSKFWTPLPGALLWCLVISSVAASRLGPEFFATQNWLRMELLKTCVAFWFVRGQPSQAVAESFDNIVRSVQVASYLGGSQQANCKPENFVAEPWPDQTHVMMGYL